MSKEHAKKFIDHVKKDEVLHEKVKSASEHIIKVAKEHGYDVTREDIKTELKERWARKEDEDFFPFSEAPGF
jgi:predicted ribosomally synthesized peptide with nif11-like leader